MAPDTQVGLKGMTKVAECSALSHQAAPPPRTGPGDKTHRVRRGSARSRPEANVSCSTPWGKHAALFVDSVWGPSAQWAVHPRLSLRALVRSRIPSCSLRHYFRGGCRSPIICGCSRRPEGALASHLPRLQAPPGTQGARNASSFDPGLLGLPPASPRCP